MSAVTVNANTKDLDVALVASFVPKADIKISDGAECSVTGAESVKGKTSVLEYLGNLAGLVPQDEAQLAQVHQWLSYSKDTVLPSLNDLGAQKAFSKYLNEYLSLRTYFVGNKLSLADLVLYVSLHPFIEKTTPKRRFEVNHLIRWFDLVQHHEKIQKFGKLSTVEFDLEAPAETVNNAPAAPAAEKKDANKKESKKQAATEPQEQDKKVKKEKKENKEKAPKQPAATKNETPELAINNPARLDIRVGKIVECKQHENADALYVEQIDLGEAQPRAIVSGLVKHVPLDEMLNRMVLVLCNLKPASMRGVKSEGMVLCATGADGKVEILLPPKDAKPGDKAFFETFEEGQPDSVLNPKKKVWETIQPGLFTDDEKRGAYKFQEEGKPERVCLFKTATGVITTATVTKGTIK